MQSQSLALLSTCTVNGFRVLVVMVQRNRLDHMYRSCIAGMGRSQQFNWTRVFDRWAEQNCVLCGASPGCEYDNVHHIGGLVLKCGAVANRQRWRWEPSEFPPDRRSLYRISQKSLGGTVTWWVWLAIQWSHYVLLANWIIRPPVVFWPYKSTGLLVWIDQKTWTGLPTAGLQWFEKAVFLSAAWQIMIVH